MVGKGMPRIAFVIVLMLILASVAVIFYNNKTKVNKTLSFFTGIELQYETPEQKEVIKQALRDMLTLSEEALRIKEYPDYLRKSGKIKIEEVIRSYFVPDDVKKTLNNQFYHELQNKEARELLQGLLDKLQTRPEKELASELIGFWHASPYLGAGFNDRFTFNNDLSFKFEFSQYNEAKRVIDFSGDWFIEGDKLICNGNGQFSCKSNGFY